MTPINKTAALVTSQSGCAESEELSIEQERECLILRLSQVDQEFAPLKSSESTEYKEELRLERFELRKQLRVLKAQRKVNNRLDRDLNQYIIDVLKKRMGKFQWSLVVKEADAIKKAEVKAANDKLLAIKSLG